jgi:adenine phosphoribosyltransferase
MDNLSKYIRNVNDYPKKGIVFRDITTLLKDSIAFNKVIELFNEHYSDKKIDKVVCIESRGFIIGSALAISLGAGFVPIRKKGKLPADVVTEKYELEYGTDTIEIHRDAIADGERILLHDDLLATGGTMCAAVKLVNSLKADVIGISFLIELSFLKGRQLLNDYDVFSLIQYNSE